MELKISADGTTRALMSNEELYCWNCKAKISFGNILWLCEKLNIVTCRKCTFSRRYSCPANANHNDMKVTLMMEVKKD